MGWYYKGAIQESKNDFFSVRLWHQGILIEVIMKHYDKFDTELKKQLPLKKISALIE
jgi:predicted Mrr-cat superfamily restriction endonuclease